MLTPSKIKNHHFEASGKNAYRAQSVDDFFDIVADSYEQMFKENGELVKKISLLAERVEEYRNDEDNIRAALLTAQRMADQIMRETNEKAEAQLAEAAVSAKKIESDATAKANEVVAAAQAEADATLAQAAATARRLIEDATAEAKEQAVIARDRMIKTQAALGLVEQEADKFKKELLTLYTEHIELISRIPEIQEEQPQEPVAEEIKEEPAPAPIVEDVIEQVVVAEDEIEDPVEEEDVVEIVEEEEVEEEAPVDEITDEKLRDLGFDVPETPTEAPVFIPDFDDEPDEEEPQVVISSDDDDDDEVINTIEDIPADDGYDSKVDGIKLDINSLRFSAAEEEDDDDDEYYDEDDDDDDDDYFDDDDDDDDDDESFGSKLKGFFKR